MLRNEVRHLSHHVTLLYGTTSPENQKAAALYEQNRFSVTRQLRYSPDRTRLR